MGQGLRWPPGAGDVPSAGGQPRDVGGPVPTRGCGLAAWMDRVGPSWGLGSGAALLAWVLAGCDPRTVRCTSLLLQLLGYAHLSPQLRGLICHLTPPFPAAGTIVTDNLMKPDQRFPSCLA